MENNSVLYKTQTSEQILSPESPLDVIKEEQNSLTYNDFTTFKDIFKLFLDEISNDYRLKKLFQFDEEMAESMLKSWLTKAIVYFYDCKQDLENNISDEEDSFTIKLTLTEKVILADFMIINWLEWETNNITQMNLSLQDNDFNTHAASQNLSAKLEYMDRYREKVYHLISEYTKQGMSIKDWAGGNI